MQVYTVLRFFKGNIIPLRSFDCLEKAQEFAELQMEFLDKDYSYGVAVWETTLASFIPCHDKRLRLVK